MRQEANITGMCEKDSMSADGIVRLSKIEVYPQYLDEYIKYAVKVGRNISPHRTGSIDNVCRAGQGESMPCDHT